MPEKIIQDLAGFFDQPVSYQIAMDMLLEAGRYDDTLRLFDVLLERNLIVNNYPRETAILAAAALYRKVGTLLYSNYIVNRALQTKVPLFDTLRMRPSRSSE